MKTVTLLLLPLCFMLLIPLSSDYAVRIKHSDSALSQVSVNQNGSRVLVPVYTNLEVLEKSNVSLWQSVPRNFSDHVATIDSRVTAMFVSSDALRFNLSSDSVGNVWMRSDYSLSAGDYVSSMMWVSSSTINQNLSSLGFTSFPTTYPSDTKAFLESGAKIQAGERAILDIAANLSQTQNMTQIVKDILDFVNQQGYDREKTRLLLSGRLNTTSMLDFFEDSLKVLETNNSICLERSWYAAAILRAAGVPTRTVTDVRLKTWIQVWLPNIGWVDAETLCAEPPPHVGMLPKPLFSSVPWMIENSSDASFPFQWLPKIRIRIANLTFNDVGLFDVNQYGTVLTEPIDAQLFQREPSKLGFPIVFEPETVYAAVTRRDLNLTFSLIQGEQNASKQLGLGELNSLTLNDLVVSFIPIQRQNFLVLQDFTVREIARLDIRVLVPIIAVPLVIVTFVLYWKTRKRT